MNSNELLDAVKTKTGAASDYALAREVLMVDPNSLREMRERGLSDQRALQIATLLNLDPGPVLAAIHAERAKDPEVKKAWEKIAKTMRSAAAAVLCVLALGLTAPEPARAAQETYPSIHYAKRRRDGWRARLAAIPPFLADILDHFQMRDYFLSRGMGMLRAMGIFGLAVLAGCGSEAGRDNHGWGWHYDQAGESGLRVRYDGAAVPALADIERLYRETMACTGISATAPLLIFTPNVPTSAGSDGAYGSVFLDTGTVFISSLLDTDTSKSAPTYKHEFIHYLLHQSGFPVQSNAGHASPLFSSCAW